MRLGLLALSGCGAVEEDMLRALARSHDALAAALISAELLDHLYDMPQSQRHSPDSACGASCPCVIQTGLVLPVDLLLDYAQDGCVPDSALVPAPMAGHLDWTFDGRTARDAVFTDLTVGDTVLDGSFRGTVDGDPLAPVLRANGELSIGDLALDLALAVSANESIVADGTVTFPDGEVVELAGVQLPWEWVGAPCPRPQAGAATLYSDRGPPVIVEYSLPGEGAVTVFRGRRASDPVLYCEFASTLW